ncbi:ATP-grasp domain-containing protein [Enterobacteriaceae bacterium H16N7]|nr:ATP-grasp domain-containing protein [Dryocola clanedunensis]
MNILIFPAGTEIGREIYSALRFCKDIDLFQGGEIYNNHALFTATDYSALPSIHQNGWLPALNEFIARHNIDFIFPAHDDVLLALAENRDEIGATVLAPATSTCQMTRSKSATYEKLKTIVNVPQRYTKEQACQHFPVFVKPDKGQGSQGACRVDSAAELHYRLDQRDDLIICEYLPGEEFTVDCFSDSETGLLYCQARTRERVRNGISMFSRFAVLAEVQDIASDIGRILNMRGAWFFQVKYNQHHLLTLLEVAPRIAGTMALSRAAGINLPLLTIYESLRYPLTFLPLNDNIQISKGTVNRYKHSVHYQHIYIDFDDTLYIEGKLCVLLMSFLIQCLNEGKQLHLITRHRGDITKQLKALRIFDMFHEIIHLSHDGPKSYSIKHQDAIFIDDSFRERSEINRSLGIPTFDNSMIELLIKD